MSICIYRGPRNSIALFTFFLQILQIGPVVHADVEDVISPLQHSRQGVKPDIKG